MWPGCTISLIAAWNAVMRSFVAEEQVMEILIPFHQLFGCQ